MSRTISLIRWNAALFTAKHASNYTKNYETNQQIRTNDGIGGIVSLVPVHC